MKKLAVILAMVVACSVACTRKPQATFPEQISGWAKQGETRTYTSENLYEYIDGDAEKYVQAGMSQTLTADYKYQSNFDAVADLFIMKNAEGARRVFESQPSVGAKPLQLGDEARLYTGSVTFRKGPYFVRLVAYNPQAGDALIELGKAIEGKLR